MFSILIPSWNNLAGLRLAVRGLQRNSAHEHQIIVHVNDGSDGTRDWVMQQQLDATFSEGHVGNCLAVNEAAQLAEHEHIVCLNDDMYCLPGWDLALLRRIETQPTDLFMLSATRVEPRDTGNNCAVVADHGGTVAEFREDELLRAAPSLKRPDWYGATWTPTLVHRKWWFNVGGYSTELSPGMGSDNDLAMKLWHAGCRRFIGVGDALVYRMPSPPEPQFALNDGPRQFLQKWGMTPSTFDRFCLRRGQPLAGDVLPDPDPAIDPGLKWALRKGALTRRFS